VRLWGSCVFSTKVAPEGPRGLRNWDETSPRGPQCCKSTISEPTFVNWENARTHFQVDLCACRKKKALLQGLSMIYVVLEQALLRGLLVVIFLSQGCGCVCAWCLWRGCLRVCVCVCVSVSVAQQTAHCACGSELRVGLLVVRRRGGAEAPQCQRTTCRPVCGSSPHAP
jgi:hypothetical protein